MSKLQKNKNIILPKNQLKLYGYNHYFNFFIQLYKKKKLPNTILLSGHKGLGKATFAYHFINYLLSINEKDKYLIDNYEINEKNKTYTNICNNTHTNFFLLESIGDDKNIKIESARNLLEFLNKSTYQSNIKIILIDDATSLNANSSNALLKAIEEPTENTFFFLINNNSNKILSTIKSRCIEFKFFFNLNIKKQILLNLIKQNEIDFDVDKIDENIFFDTPGNILRYLQIIYENNISSLDDKADCISQLIDKYKIKKDTKLLIFISTLVELFYSELASRNSKKLNIYFLNKSRILKRINEAINFNLDTKNLFIDINGIIKNES